MEIFLANIAGVVKSPTVPLDENNNPNKSVIWAKQIDPENLDKVILYVFDFNPDINDWMPLYNKATQILLGSVSDFASEPPGAPGVGETYIIGSDAVGAWAGREKQIAEYTNDGWIYATPKKLSFVFLAIEETFYYYTDAYPAGLWDQALGGGVASFNGNRPIKRLPTLGLNPGGTTAKEFLENLYYPFVSALVSINSFPLLQVGVNYAPPVTGSITLNDVTDVTAVRVLDVTAGTILDTQDPVINPGQETVPVSFEAPVLAITKGVVNQYKIEADVDEDGSPATKSSATRTVEGVYPYLYGMSSTNLGEATIYAALTKLIAKENDLDIPLNGENMYIYFAFDADYPDLVDIKNNSDFSVIANFTKTVINVQSAGLDNDWSKSYKVYKLNNLTTVNNGTFKFIS